MNQDNHQPIQIIVRCRPRNVKSEIALKTSSNVANIVYVANITHIHSKMLLSHVGPPLHSMPWCATTALPFSNTHHTPSQVKPFSCATSAGEKWRRMQTPGPLRKCSLPFLPWSPVRILSQAPITLQFRPEPKLCSLTIQPVHQCMYVEEALRGSFPFSGVNLCVCPLIFCTVALKRRSKSAHSETKRSFSTAVFNFETIITYLVLWQFSEELR